jgi:hypothetical protein
MLKQSGVSEFNLPVFYGVPLEVYIFFGSAILVQLIVAIIRSESIKDFINIYFNMFSKRNFETYTMSNIIFWFLFAVVAIAVMLYRTIVRYMQWMMFKGARGVGMTNTLIRGIEFGVASTSAGSASLSVGYMKDTSASAIYNNYAYIAPAFQTPTLSSSWTPTFIYGGSGSTPEQIQGWSLNLNEDMFIGAHVSFGLNSLFPQTILPWKWFSGPDAWFSGYNSGSGTAGLNFGTSLSFSYTILFPGVPRGIAVDYSGQYTPFQPGIQQGVPAGDVAPASGQPSGGNGPSLPAIWGGTQGAPSSGAFTPEMWRNLSDGASGPVVPSGVPGISINRPDLTAPGLSVDFYSGQGSQPQPGIMQGAPFNDGGASATGGTQEPVSTPSPFQDFQSPSGAQFSPDTAPSVSGGTATTPIPGISVVTGAGSPETAPSFAAAIAQGMDRAAANPVTGPQVADSGQTMTDVNPAYFDLGAASSGTAAGAFGGAISPNGNGASSQQPAARRLRQRPGPRALRWRGIADLGHHGRRLPAGAGRGSGLRRPGRLRPGVLAADGHGAQH